jgi:predicted RNA binding protein YcfA (HicA-like mRNA interferase family)
MSRSLPAVTGREVLKALVGVGFVHVSTKGSHAKVAHPDGRTAVGRCMMAETSRGAH